MAPGRNLARRIGRHFRWRHHAVMHLGGFCRDFDMLVLLQLCLACVAVHLCVASRIHCDPILVALLVTPLVFPVSFSINESHQRRQMILRAVATIRAELWTMYAFHVEVRHRIQRTAATTAAEPVPGAAATENLGASAKSVRTASTHASIRTRTLAERLGQSASATSSPPAGAVDDTDAGQPESADELATSEIFNLIIGFLRQVRCYATQERSIDRNLALEKVYQLLRQMRGLNTELLNAVTARRLKAGAEDVVLFRSLGEVVGAFEQIRVGRDYPAPRSARQFHKVVGFLFPVLLAPAFAAAADTGDDQEWSAYYLAALCSLIYSMLIGIQDTLDNPFNCYEFDTTGDAPRMILAHPDNIDFARLEYYPFLSMSGTITLPSGAVADAQTTLHGGPLPELRPHVSEIFAGIFAGTADDDSENRPKSAIPRLGVKIGRDNNSAIRSAEDPAALPRACSAPPSQGNAAPPNAAGVDVETGAQVPRGDAEDLERKAVSAPAPETEPPDSVPQWTRVTSRSGKRSRFLQMRSPVSEPDDR